MAENQQEESRSLETLRHSCSHLMAEAVQSLYPEAKLAIGPAIENGFYYDFDLPQRITEEDLARIEDRMMESVKRNQPFTCEQWSAAEAIAFFEGRGEKYKVELIRDLGVDSVSVYKHGDFVDLCRGPHVDSTGQIRFFKLLSVAGAYWRGDEKNAMLQRIYGTAFYDKKELKDYLQHLEEAKQRDHRRLGPALRLFEIFQDEAGAGFVFYLERGTVLRRLIEDWEIREHNRRGYEMVLTPHLLEEKLFKRSGHLDHYGDLMYCVNEEDTQACIKPMNCPGHMLIYKSKTRSYRDLPLRMFELGTVYRKEKSGVLHGLLRVRGFTQDDAHIFCREDQLESELKGVLEFVKDAMKTFGFENYEAELSTRPESYIGELETWNMAEGILDRILKNGDIPYSICPGEGAFYGPKIDIKLKDALGRKWQCATVQLDFNLPQRFELSYVDSDGARKTPIMLHRVILGSYERFLATLIEHYKGAFPLWLAPVQVKVLSLKSTCIEYAQEISGRLNMAGIRCEADVREETLSRKIREAELEKVPYILVLGEQEKDKGTVNVRTRGKKTLGEMSVEDLLGLLEKEKQSSAEG